MKYLFILIVVILLIMVGLSFMSSRTPDRIGLVDGRLRDCPDSDNCVSSLASSEAKQVAPIAVHGPAADVMASLVKAIESMEGGAVAEMSGPYLRAVFTSSLWRFRDDLECLYDQDGEVIQVRSAARVGYSDFGANRKRVEELRTLLAAD